MPKTVIIPISLPKSLARELDHVAHREAMTRSEFIRDLVRRRIAFTRLDQFREEFSRRAQKSGIRTLQDAVRVVKAMRKKR